MTKTFVLLHDRTIDDGGQLLERKKSKEAGTIPACLCHSLLDL